MPDGTCPICGKVLPKKPPSLKLKYCSRECSREAERLRPVTVICPCGTEFKAPASAVTWGRKYCSAACYHKVGPGRRAEFVWVTCPCGVKFETRAWKIAEGRGKYCSRQCSARFIVRKVPPRPKISGTPEYARRQYLARYHQMTPDDMLALIAEQDGRCYLCREVFNLEQKMAVQIDHDHRCCPAGYSCAHCRRGLACRRCNMLIGKVLDDSDLLRLIAENLEKAKDSLKLEARPSKSLSVGWLDFLVPTLRRMDLSAAGK